MSKRRIKSPETEEIQLRKKLAKFILAFADTPKWDWEVKHFAGHLAEYVEYGWDTDWKWPEAASGGAGSAGEDGED